MWPTAPLLNYTLSVGPGKLATRHCLTRGFSDAVKYSLTAAAVANATRSTNFETFRVMLEGDFTSFRPHNGGHVAVGGEMSNFYSSPGGTWYSSRYSKLCHLPTIDYQSPFSGCITQISTASGGTAESICFPSLRDIGPHYEDGTSCRIDTGLHPEDGKHGPQCYRPRCNGPPCRAQLLYLRLIYPTLPCLGVITIFHDFFTTFTQFMML